jgi:transposase
MQTIVTREAIAEAYSQGLEAVVSLFDQVLEPVLAQVASLTARVEELERQRALDSHNSSKPPSTDPPGSRPSPKSLRQPSGKKSGGQPGHRGSTLRMSESPKHIVRHTPERCESCGASLADAPIIEVERRQVIDLPPVMVEVVEHQVETKQCPCGQRTHGSFPEGVEAPVQYGPGLKGLVVYLNHGQLLPMERTAEILTDVFGCESFSEGTLDNAVVQCYEDLAEVENKIKVALQQAGVAHFDETGLEVDGKLNWLHVASTASLTHYGWDAKRGAEGAEAIGILPKFQGVGVHDGLETYWRYGWTHALCNGHHLRELTFVEEQLAQPWATDMMKLLREIKGEVAEARASGATSLPSDVEQGFVHRYASILATGFAANPPPERPPGTRGRPKRGKVLSLLDRLSNHQDAALRFMRDFAVPFDNNQAERDLRMVKVKQKVSGCFRTSNGADMFCRIRGYISTVRKQGKHALACLRTVFEGSPSMPALTT